MASLVMLVLTRGYPLITSGLGHLFGSQDPFECVQCGRWDLSLVYFLLLPVVPRKGGPSGFVDPQMASNGWGK